MVSLKLSALPADIKAGGYTSKLLEYAQNSTKSLISVLTKLTLDNVLLWQGDAIIGWTSDFGDQRFSFVISNNEPPTLTFYSTELVCFNYEGDYGLDNLRDAIFIQKDGQSSPNIRIRPDPMVYCR